MWSTTFNFLLALIIFISNLLLLISISSSPRLHSPFHLLSTNLWICNIISAIVTIFFTLSKSSSPNCVFPSSPLTETTLSSKILPPSRFPSRSLDYFDFSAHSMGVLLNSTLSLLSLLSIGIIHALYTHNYRLSKCQSSRVLLSTWFLALLLITLDFVLLRLGPSSWSSLVLPFHLALLSVLLLLNLLLHPTNLILLSKSSVSPSSPTTRPSQTESIRISLLDECTTASLWLLLNSLSFVIIAMMVVWNVRGDKSGNEDVLGIEMAAYSVHCIANPLIAVIRDRRLEYAIGRILRTNKRQVPIEDDLVLALMRDPPPPYSI
ncbi:hypothetical protein PRIPAC_75798 [Pristionchus pacificus]|uniref:G_PROTEIN_RECEP_F1_2 domain-containing protein n=1 Tax=Pristionchus pacificus TaxID=54126 RepID=A0A2A6BGB2_PRIPA|nr:hypothetical protein PRIPAC_75798 [Pristionchus pacificus]|eukprot:PDM64841.1 hypothetical protein PRIPAC_53097 [Pristionchus pacificus]